MPPSLWHSCMASSTGLSKSDPTQSNWAFSPSVCGAVGFVEVMSPSHSFIQHWYFCLGTKYTGVCERSPMEMKAPGL